MFTCPLCSKQFVTRAYLESHTRSHTKEKPHKCLICSATFGYASGLHKHIQCVREGHRVIEKRIFQCQLCSYKFNTNSMLKVHLRKHSDYLPFSCSVPSCGFKTKYDQSLKEHVRNIHSDERPHKCPSDGCSYKAKDIKALRSHLRIHSNEKPFTCRVQGCDYACKTKRYLTAHISRAHSDEKPFKCSFCDFQAKSRAEVYHHKYTHTKIKRFKCPAANCSFASSVKMTVAFHFDSKHREKDVLCTEPKCNFRCGSIAVLTKHLQRHAKSVFKCPGDSCRYSTKVKTSLAKHISRCHNDVQSAMVVAKRLSDLEILHCSFPQCDFQTKFPHLYDRHTSSHNKDEGRRNYVCSFCFSRFRYLSWLEAHVQRHVKEKPYNCSLCDYTAGECVNFVNHAKTHHIHVTPRGKQDEVKNCRTCGRTCWSYSEVILHSLSHLKPVVVLERLRVHSM